MASLSHRLLAITSLAVGIYCDQTLTVSSWSVSQDDLSCSTPQRRFAINDTGHDAILITLRSNPTLNELLCNDDLDLRISFGEQGVLSRSLCPDNLRNQFTFYTTSLSIAVTRSALNCTASKAFNLSVDYSLLRCWNTPALDVTSNQTLRVNYPCGRMHSVDLHISQLYNSKVVIIDTGSYRSAFVEITLNDSLVLDWSSWRQPATEMDLHISKTIRLDKQLPFMMSRPICETMNITFNLFPSNHSIDICPLDDAFTISEAADILRTRLVLQLPRYQVDSYWDYLTSYSIVIDIRFGPRGYIDPTGEEQQHVLPFQLWQSDLQLRAHFLFDRVPFLDSWFYRLYINVPPGRQIHARWSPLEKQSYAISFWDSMSQDSEETSNGAFKESLGTFWSGEANSFTNRMVMEVAVDIALWQQERSSREKVLLTVVYLHTTSMENMCDDTNGNVSVVRQVLENTETVAAFKTGMKAMEQFNCRLTFRTLTDDAVFLARIWLTTADGCQRSTYYVVFGETRGRYVQLCTNVDAKPYIFILSNVVSLVTYLRRSPTADALTGIAGHFITTCPPSTDGSCRWTNGTLDTPLDEGTAQNVVYCGAILSAQLTASTSREACLFTLNVSESSWKQAFAQPNQVDTVLYLNYTIPSDKHPRPTSAMFTWLTSQNYKFLYVIAFDNPNSFFACHVMAYSSQSWQQRISLGISYANIQMSMTFEIVEERLDRVFYTVATEFNFFLSVPTWLSWMLEFAAVPRAPADPRGSPCPPAFVALANHCYNVTQLSDAVTWEEAGEDCSKRGATLLTIADRDEADVVLRLLEPFNALYENGMLSSSEELESFIYIGLRRFNGTFRWDDAAVPLGFQAWYHPSDFDGLSTTIFSSFLALDDNVSQPTDDNGDCVVMVHLRPDDPRLNWAVIPCQSAFPANTTILQICMVRNRLDEATNASWPTAFCPQGWLKVSGQCEKMVSAVNMTAGDAVVRCGEEASAVAAFNSSLHNLLFRLLMQQHRDGDKWLNNTERGQLTAYRLLSGMRRSLVPLSAPVTGGVICERNAQIQVNVQHGFEVLCSNGVFVSFTRGCGRATCDENSTDTTCASQYTINSTRSNQTRQIFWAMDAARLCDEDVVAEPVVEAKSGWIELNKTARKEEVVLTGNRTCGAHSVACARSEGECTDQSAICIYGVPGCSDGSHLLDCESFECPLLFKCPQSYCIHLDRVGDGSNDCPHGHDELLGDRICAGLFRCGTRCIPLGLVCDHAIHCEDGEDEQFCPRPPDNYCPPGCTCQNVLVTCPSFNSSLRIPAVTESVDLSVGYLKSFSPLDMTIARRLLLLNLSSNLLSTIPRNTFLCLRSLLHLDLSHNRLKTLQLGAFEGLLALRSIRLTGNRITTVESFAFAPLQNVTQLDLSEMYLTVIPGNAFSGMQKLHNLSLTGSPIAVLERGAFRGLPALLAMDIRRCSVSQFDAELFDEDRHVDVFLSDLEELCCAPSSVTRCEPFSPTVMPFCRRLLPISQWSWIGPTLLAVGMLGCLSVIVWMLVREKKNAYRGMMAIMFLNHMLIGVAVALLHVVDNQYGNEFFVFSRGWSQSPVCLAAGMLIVVGCLGSSGTLTVLLATYLCKLKRAVLILSLLAVLVVQLSVSLPWLLLGVQFCTRLPACVPLLLIHHPWWLLSLFWMLFIVVLPQPFTLTAMSRVRSEWAQLKQLDLRQFDKLSAKLDLLRALLVGLLLTVSNLAVGTVWLLEAFVLLGEGQPGHLWSTITLLLLQLVLQPLAFGLSVALAKRYMKRISRPLVSPSSTEAH